MWFSLGNKVYRNNAFQDYNNWTLIHTSAHSSLIHSGTNGLDIFFMSATGNMAYSNDAGVTWSDKATAVSATVRGINNVGIDGVNRWVALCDSSKVYHCVDGGGNPTLTPSTTAWAQLYDSTWFGNVATYDFYSMVSDSDLMHLVGRNSATNKAIVLRALAEGSTASNGWQSVTVEAGASSIFRKAVTAPIGDGYRALFGGNSFVVYSFFRQPNYSYRGSSMSGLSLEVGVKAGIVKAANNKSR
jgi:hypothetical protein